VMTHSGSRYPGVPATAVMHGLQAHAVVDEPRKAEVAELGVEGLVQHDVARLDVAMDDALVPLLVEVQHGGR